MKLTLNPFKLRRLLRHYEDICQKQCVALSNANSQIVELVAENCLLKQQIQTLNKEQK